MRQSSQHRQTKETDIKIDLVIDDPSFTEIDTSVKFFDHMLEQFSRHGLFGLKIVARGDTDIDDHHLVEDTGIVLGQAFAEALGRREQITRYASARVPMDEVLVAADIDLTTRPFLIYDLEPGREFIGQFDASLPLEFWRGFVNNAGLNLHIELIRGGNAHHIIEASFKSVAIALSKACQLDSRKSPGQAPSTKGIL